jgi:hypothetical protein
LNLIQQESIRGQGRQARTRTAARSAAIGRRGPSGLPARELRGLAPAKGLGRQVPDREVN